ncbi:hypothetical protein O603_02762, partial [Staphylococcus aureus M0557]
PLHNITKEQYKERENDIEIIGHFKNYINTESEETHSNIINSIKNELKQERDNLEM